MTIQIIDGIDIQDIININTLHATLLGTAPRRRGFQPFRSEVPFRAEIAHFSIEQGKYFLRSLSKYGTYTYMRILEFMAPPNRNLYGLIKLNRKVVTENQRCDCLGQEQHPLRRLLLSHTYTHRCHIPLVLYIVDNKSYFICFKFFNTISN